MWRAIRLLSLCVALSGCSMTGGLSSVSLLGESSSEAQPKLSMAQGSSPSQTANSSGSIWSNFSSTFSSGTPPVQPAPKTGEETAAGLNPAEALRLVNDYRASKGLAALSLETHATAAAEIIVKDMAKTGQMSHAGPNGATLQNRLTMAGYRYKLAAENVAAGQKSFKQIIEGWKQSPAHSRNMLLAEAKHMGIAYEYRPDTPYQTYWSLVVAAP